MQVASNEGSMRLFRMVRSFPDEPGDVFYVGLIGLLPRVRTPCRWDDTAQCARFVELARGFHRNNHLAVAMADQFARRWQRHWVTVLLLVALSGSFSICIVRSATSP